MIDQILDYKEPDMDIEERDYEHIEKMMTLQFESLKEALETRNFEVSRRLDLLNGESERLRIMQSDYIPREVYQQQHEEHGSRIASIEGSVTDYITFKAVLQSKASQSSVWIGYGFSILSVMTGFMAVLISIIFGVITLIIKFYA